MCPSPPLPSDNKSAKESTRWAGLDEETQESIGVRGETTPPEEATEAKERWNYPRRNIRRVMACFYSFLVMGANDAAYGVS